VIGGALGRQVYIKGLSALNKGLSTLRGAPLALEGVNRLSQLLETSRTLAYYLGA